MKLKSALPIILGLSLNAVYAADTATATPATAPATAAAAPASGAAPAAAASTLTSDQDKVSYSIGVDLGRNLKQQDIAISDTVFMQGIHDGMNGEPKLMTKDQVIDTLKKLQKQIADRREANFKKSADDNKKKGDAFMADNKTKPGVITTTSGLQYKVIDDGKGPSPKPTDIVTVNYKGTLIDGTEFDSSYKRGVPATFPLNGVIPGWVEALQLMKAGSKWQVYIPSNLAYGEQGAGPEIGPNETLIFEVSLISFKPGTEDSKTAAAGDDKAAKAAPTGDASKAATTGSATKKK